MTPVSLVVAGPPEARYMAEQAGMNVLAEAPDYAAAKDLLLECGADAILHYGIPQTPVDAGIPTIAIATGGDLDDAVAFGPYTVVPENAAPSLVVAAVATAGAYVRAVVEAREETAALREDLETRKLVERAKGILMKRLGIGEDDAYRRLQKASQNENRKMRDVADSIVRTENILAENLPAGRKGKRTAG